MYINTAAAAVSSAEDGVMYHSPSSPAPLSISIIAAGKMRALQSESSVASLLLPIADENDWHE